ncbi:PAS domain-containing protein, partial [bacterium]|nr:PAS domain-containing protein [bacterium]
MNYIIVVSEDNAISYSLKVILKEKFLVEEVKPSDIFNVISKRKPSVIFLDTYLSEENPEELMDEVLKEFPDLAIIVLVSSYSSLTTKFIEKGAFDILEKPFTPYRVEHLVNRAIEREKLIMENKTLKEGEKVVSEKGLEDERKGEEDFFQLLFQTIAENFSEIEKFSLEILKTIKKKFYFSNMAIFLLEGGIFKPFSSIGIDENILKEIKLSSSSSLAGWFMRKNRVLNIQSESEIPHEIRGFMEILNCKIAIPLKTFGGKLLGFITAGDKLTGEEISLKEISSLSLLSDYLATVFENIFLYSEIKLQKNFQEAVFENIPAGVIGVDRKGNINILNKYAEKILRIEFDEIKGKKIEKVGSQMAHFLRKALENEETVRREEFKFIPTNSILGISTNCVKNNKGEIIGAVAIFQDLTFIKEAERKEKISERNK